MKEKKKRRMGRKRRMNKEKEERGKRRHPWPWRRKGPRAEPIRVHVTAIVIEPAETPLLIGLDVLRRACSSFLTCSCSCLGPANRWVCPGMWFQCLAATIRSGCWLALTLTLSTVNYNSRTDFCCYSATWTEPESAFVATTSRKSHSQLFFFNISFGFFPPFFLLISIVNQIIMICCFFEEDKRR